MHFTMEKTDDSLVLDDEDGGPIAALRQLTKKRRIVSKYGMLYSLLLVFISFCIKCVFDSIRLKIKKLSSQFEISVGIDVKRAIYILYIIRAQRSRNRTK